METKISPIGSLLSNLEISKTDNTLRNDALSTGVIFESSAFLLFMISHLQITHARLLLFPKKSKASK